MERMLNSVYQNNVRYANDPEMVSRLHEIISVMKKVDRKNFVLPEYEKACYSDEPLPIGNGQTISQPTTVARMLLLSKLEKGNDILEIGSGSGWSAVLTALLVFPGVITSVERIKALAELTKKNFSKLNSKLKIKTNVKFVFANAMDKKSEIWKKKYNRIIFTAGVGFDFAEKVKKMAAVLLKEKGLLLYPTNELGSYGAIELWQLKQSKLVKHYREEGYAFVPLLGGEE